MIRLALPLVGLLVGVGCSFCPTPACTAWLYVDLTTPTWTVGTYLLDVEAPDRALHCTIGIPRPGAAPTLADVACGDQVVRGGFVFDTGGSNDPQLVELRGVLGSGADRPAQATVRVRHRSPAGQEAVLLDEPRALPWGNRPPPSKTCAVDCATAELVVEVPEVVGTERNAGGDPNGGVPP